MELNGENAERLHSADAGQALLSRPEMFGTVSSSGSGGAMPSSVLPPPSHLALMQNHMALASRMQQPQFAQVQQQPQLQHLLAMHFQNINVHAQHMQQQVLANQQRLQQRQLALSQPTCMLAPPSKDHVETSSLSMKPDPEPFTAPPQSQQAAPPAHGNLQHAKVGGRVSVYWDGERRWYNGTVRAYSQERGFLVLYDDDEEHWEPADTVHPGERTLVGKPKAANAPSGARKGYLCGVCGLPKKGHVCTGRKRPADAGRGDSPSEECDEVLRGKRGRKSVTRYTDEEFESPKPLSRQKERDKERERGWPEGKTRKRMFPGVPGHASERGGRSSRRRCDGENRTEEKIFVEEDRRVWWRESMSEDAGNEVWWARVDLSKNWLQVATVKNGSSVVKKPGGRHDDSHREEEDAEGELEREERAMKKLSLISPIRVQVGFLRQDKLIVPCLCFSMH
jgi:hypothetical protein